METPGMQRLRAEQAQKARSRANATKTIKEYFSEGNSDFDSFDVDYGCVVTCVAAYFDAPIEVGTEDEFYNRFYDFVISRVLVVDEDTYVNVVCDWSRFVYRYYDVFENFMRKNWKNIYNDETIIVSEWIEEIHWYLAGYTSEPMYRELYEDLMEAEGKEPCKRYEKFLNEEIKPHISV